MVRWQKHWPYLSVCPPIAHNLDKSKQLTQQQCIRGYSHLSHINEAVQGLCLFTPLSQAAPDYLL